MVVFIYTQNMTKSHRLKVVYGEFGYSFSEKIERSYI